jgi:phosphoribosyl-ATP pyrophosphohydrolase
MKKHSKAKAMRATSGVEPKPEPLSRLYRVLAGRKGADPARSYTAKLLQAGRAAIAKKLGEEAVELALAAAQGSRGPAIRESADLLYHLLVLWADLKIEPEDVYAELRAREGRSGLAEKAARQQRGGKQTP